MIIRQATIQDAVSIKRLMAQLGYSSLSEEDVIKKIEGYSQDNYQLQVGEIDQEVIAFISLHWFDIFHSSGKIGRISAFCVEERLRVKGLGKQLLEAAEKLLIEEGCSKIEVTSNIKRTLSHKFYLKNGYTEDSRRFTKYP